MYRHHLVWLISLIGLTASLAPPGPATAATYLVNVNGSQTAPYNTWAIGFSNIQAAVDHASDTDTILVTNGTYQLSAPIVVGKGVGVHGVNGRESTIVDGRGAVYCFYVTNQNAVVSGLTITGGKSIGTVPFRAAGIILHAQSPATSGGTVSNCVITGNSNTSFYAGAAYVRAGGTIRDCVITNNHTTTYGAIEVESGNAVIEDCVISDNTGGGQGGGGISIWGSATVRNCLISGNSVSGRGGGIAFESGSVTVENCTIVGNTGNGLGGGVYMSPAGATLKNSIVYFNSSSSAATNIHRIAGSISYICSTDFSGTTGSISDDPQFQGAGVGNYRLAEGSPCRNIAQSNAWMNSATDLDGNPRILESGPDIGAYEFDPNGPLTCDFSGTPQLAPAPLQVIFTGTVGGPTNGLVVYWDFEQDGTNDQTGLVATNTYSPGTYSVAMTASNGVGTTCLIARTNYITAGAPILVWESGTQQSPYDTWAKAYNNIADAMDASVAGDKVLVSNGTYVLAQTLLVSNGINVVSAGGSAVTTIDGNDSVVCLHLSNENAHVSGFTITGGRGNGTLPLRSAAVNIQAPPAKTSGGTVSNCVIAGNTMIGFYASAGFIKNGGSILDCVLTNNSSTTYGAIEVEGGNAIIDRCVIAHNSGGYAGGGGVSIWGGATLRNCLIAGNTVSGRGGGLALENNTGITIENCTIVRNATGNLGGGIFMDTDTASSVLRNLIVYFNSASSGNSNIHRTVGSLSYLCSTDFSGTTGSTADDPAFDDAGSGFGPSATLGNYHIRSDSPANKSGLNQAWMTSGVDLDGEQRIQGGTVNMGAYETVVAAGTVMIVR